MRSICQRIPDPFKTKLLEIFKVRGSKFSDPVMLKGQRESHIKNLSTGKPGLGCMLPHLVHYGCMFDPNYICHTEK